MRAPFSLNFIVFPPSSHYDHKPFTQGGSVPLFSPTATWPQEACEHPSPQPLFPSGNGAIHNHQSRLPVSSETEIRVGERHEAYIYVKPDIGNAVRSSITQQLGMGLAQDVKKISLDFNHRSRYFAHSSFPRDILDDISADAFQKLYHFRGLKLLRTFLARPTAIPARPRFGYRVIGML